MSDVGAAPATGVRLGGYALTAATSAWIVDVNVVGGFEGLDRDDPEGAPGCFSAPSLSISLSLSLASLSSAADLSTIVRRPEPSERSMCAHF